MNIQFLREFFANTKPETLAEATRIAKEITAKTYAEHPMTADELGLEFNRLKAQAAQDVRDLNAGRAYTDDVPPWGIAVCWLFALSVMALLIWMHVAFWIHK